MPGSKTRQPLVTAISIKRPLTAGFRTLLILVSLLAIAAAGIAWHNQQQHHKSRRQLNDANARLDALDQRLQALQSAQDGTSDRLQQQQEAVDRVVAGGSAARQRWLLGRVTDSVSVAEQALALSRNIAAARLSLAGADTLLAAQPDAGLLPLRRALRSDLDMLASLPAPDIDGLYLRLQLLDRRLQAIDLPRDIGQRQPAKTASLPATTPGDSVRHLWDAGLARFRELIVIRQYDQPLQPLLDEARRQLVKQQLSILLSQAELAVLRGDGLIYRSALETLSLRLQHDLAALPHAALAPLLNELADLQAQQIQSSIPPLSSHAALDALEPATGAAL